MKVGQLTQESQLIDLTLWPTWVIEVVGLTRVSHQGYGCERHAYIRGYGQTYRETPYAII